VARWITLPTALTALKSSIGDGDIGSRFVDTNRFPDCLRYPPLHWSAFAGASTNCSWLENTGTVTGWSHRALNLVTARPCTVDRCVRPHTDANKATVRSLDALACVLPSRLKKGAFATEKGSVQWLS
jgi:hypothetical protein